MLAATLPIGALSNQVGTRLNFPCKYLEKLLSLPIYLPLYNRSGLNCRIEKGGIVHRGDVVEPVYDS